MEIISYGGGVQSTALVILATQGRIGATHAIMANVGDDSENPATLDYVRNIITPWAAERGVQVLELNRHKRDGSIETLHGRLTHDVTKSIPIPIYFSGGAPGGRSCTADFKIRVIGKWLKANGASAKNPATVNIGISLDEIRRLSNRFAEPYERPVYPLIDMRLTRQDCMNIIERTGLPIPEKSSCYFCPFHRLQAWREMKRDKPELFGQAVALEQRLNDKRKANGKDGVYLSRTLRPLELIETAQDELYGEKDDPCDSGYCMT